MYEETNRVPFIIRYPGKLPANKRMSGLFSLVDLAPTILDLTGIKHAEHFDGYSAMSAIKQAAPHFRDAVFAEIFEIIDQRCLVLNVRTEKWKYNMYFGDIDELYDMENDPLELTNLAEQPGMVTVVDGLQKTLQQWLLETGGLDMVSLLAKLGKDRPMNYLSKQIGMMATRSI